MNHVICFKFLHTNEQLHAITEGNIINMLLNLFTFTVDTRNELNKNITQRRTKLHNMNDKQERKEMKQHNGLPSESKTVLKNGDAKCSARQLPESKFLTKVENIPIIHNVWNTSLAMYSRIKEKHPKLKDTLERGEDAAYWVEQKAENLATFTKLNEPLKKIDSVAYNSVVKLEDTQKSLRKRFQSVNNHVQTQIQYTTAQIPDRTKAIRSYIFASIHTLVDYVGKTFEPIMPKDPPQEENSPPQGENSSTDPGVINTIGRLAGVTGMFIVGVLAFAVGMAGYLTDGKNWGEPVIIEPTGPSVSQGEPGLPGSKGVPGQPENSGTRGLPVAKEDSGVQETPWNERNRYKGPISNARLLNTRSLH